MQQLLETESESEILSHIGVSPVTIVVPVYNAYEDFVRCVEAIERNTDISVPLLIADDQGPDRRMVEFLRRYSTNSIRRVAVLQNSENLGFVGTCNRAFRATGNSDVVLINSDVVVGPQWLDGLVEAAASSNLVATVSTLTNHGSILSTPTRNTPKSELDGGLAPDTAARLVFQSGLGISPTIPTAVGHCILIRRFALQLLGGFDEKFGMGYGEEVDFSLRAVRYGLRNVLADKVFTYHKGNSSFGINGRNLQIHNDRIIRSHFPWYDSWVHSESVDMHSPLADALVISASALRGLHLGVDARCLGPDISGTQRVVLETIRSLSTLDDVAKLLVYLPGEVPSYALEFTREAQTVEFITPAKFGESDRSCDVIYRPYQLQHPSDLDWLRLRGNRVIVNQLDLISYNNPTYFKDFKSWRSYRELTKLALGAVDAVAFISEHAKQEAITAGVVGDGTLISVVGCGVDLDFELSVAEAPRGFPDNDGPLILCLGHSYHHKNRLWAMKLFRKISERGWDGRLVLAGSNPPVGNSLADEAELLLGMPDLAGRVTFMSGISEEEKQWLMDRSSLILYPTVVEGFGLIPFEAAAQNIPVLSTRQGSLDEVLPQGIPVVDDLDLDRACDLALVLLTDGDAAKAAVAAMQVRSRDFNWNSVATRIVELAQQTLTKPGRSTTALNAEKMIDWFDENELAIPDGETRALSFWLEQIVKWRPRNERLMRLILPERSRRQIAFRQFVNHLRSKLTH